MHLQVEEIRLEIERVLTSLEEQGNELTLKLRPILATNLKKGRVQSFIQDDIDNVSNYVQRMLDLYQRFHVEIEQLQTDRTSNAWELTFNKMQCWAYNWFLRKNFYPGVDTQEIASECATEASTKLLKAEFPYDTDFEPWAHVIVLHICQKYIQKGMKLETQLGKMVELEKLSNIADSAIDDLKNQKEINTHLLEALAKIPTQRRQVIVSIYFDELSPPEIAKKMGKSISAIYSLHFNALIDLRKIMSEETTDDSYE